ncbi:MAG TPA: hypothetical protein VGG72_01525 [Bryobacteraceae bacterium]
MAIPLPPGWSFAYGEAVNASGQVAGEGMNGSGLYQAFIGAPSGSTAIPLPSGWTGASGYAVNVSGQVAGNGTNARGLAQAFIGTTAGSSAIPPPSGGVTTTIALGSLNNSGVVVGSADGTGWIWDATNGTRLLTSLVPSGWSVGSAISISNNGLILAMASYNGAPPHWVELTPSLSPVLPSTPAPSTLTLLLIGVIFCLGWRVRILQAAPKRKS